MIKVSLNLFSYLTISLFLVSCTTVEKQESISETEENKPELQDPIPVTWNARGRIAVLHPDENWHAHFVWQQTAADYQLKFSGPLGQTQLFIEHRQAPQTEEQSNTLIVGDKKYYNSSSMQELLEQFSPIKVPLTSLKYWLFGQPNPLAPYRIIRDKEEKIIKIQQLGWDIDFKKYQSSQIRGFPNKITAQKNKHKIKVFIKQREFEG